MFRTRPWAAALLVVALAGCDPNAVGGLPVPSAQPSGNQAPAPGVKKGPGHLPVAVSKVQNLGVQKTDTREFLERDLGFSGLLGGRPYWTFGDTGAKDLGIRYDTIAKGDLADPTRVTFGTSGLPDTWIPLTDTERQAKDSWGFAMGGTNIIEYAPGKALVYYVKNDRRYDLDHDGGNENQIKGAGVATVTLVNGRPKATRTRPVHTANTDPEDKQTLLWNPGQPTYGSIGATYDPRDKKIYAYGDAPDGKGGVYLARVPADRASDVTAYEYWDENRRSWYTGVKPADPSRELFRGPLSNFSQNNMFWSNHYNTWMSVTSGGVFGKKIAVRTAPDLEGPWSPFTVLADGCPAGPDWSCYAITPHPEYDDSGRTLLVSFTQANIAGHDKMTIQLRRLTFK